MKTTFSAFAISAMLLSAVTFSDPIIVADTKATAKVEQVQSTSFDFVRTHRQGKGAVISWAVTSSNGVARFAVKKTYEDPSDPYAYWEEAASTSCNGSRSYKAKDENVFPGFINYRVVAEMADGSTVESAVQTVHIVSH